MQRNLSCFSPEPITLLELKTSCSFFAFDLHDVSGNWRFWPQMSFRPLVRQVFSGDFSANQFHKLTYGIKYLLSGFSSLLTKTNSVVWEVASFWESVKNSASCAQQTVFSPSALFSADSKTLYLQTNVILKDFLIRSKTNFKCHLSKHCFHCFQTSAY